MDWARFAQHMAAMARDLLAQTSVDATLRRVTASATELVEAATRRASWCCTARACRRSPPATHGSSTVTGCRSGCGKARASTPPAAPWAPGSSASRTSAGSSRAGPPTPRETGAFTEAGELAGWLLASHAAVAFSGARTHAQLEQA
ncbi:hypothetical protein GCM10010245_19070 [Streptomyces spectabilis]|nr:hypothetical protein GCM10010245_19070 [Streptomyces spectabilis]